MLLPLLLLSCIELVLRVAGYGYPTAFFLKEDIAGQTMLVDNHKFGWRFFGPALARTPRPMEFPALKPARTCRVFVFGESAAYGDPKPEFGLPRFLEVMLQDRYPGVRFEVVNAAMTGINSHVILPIARDCARESGDVWVIYMGNNEVVGPFGSGTVFGIQAPPLLLIRVGLWLKTTRTGQCLVQWAHRATSRGESQWQGMAMFVHNQVRQNDPRMRVVYAHFRRNLRDIIAAGRVHNAAVVVSTVLSNLKDCAPFGSEHRPDLPPDNLTAWQDLYRGGVEAENARHCAQAVEQFQRAAGLDDQFAELQYRWGRCCLALGRDDEAREHFVRARDYDTLRFRTDSRLNLLICAAAGSTADPKVRLVEAERELAAASPHGIPGAEMLYEHVHLNFHGNYCLALAILGQVREVLPTWAKAQEAPGWLSEAQCAERLAWTDWDRYRSARSVMLRLCQPPFTSQCDHDAQYRRIRQELDNLLPAQRSTALQGAVASYRHAVALSPGDWVLERNLGELLRKLGDLAGAEACLRKSIELLPHDSMGHFELGLLLVQLHRPEQGRAEFDLVLRSDPGSVPALNAWALASAQMGDSSIAVETLQRALRLKPGSADTRLNLGGLFEAAGRKEEAQTQFRLALQERLETPDLLIRAGKLCMVQGWAEQAITNFSRAAILDPTDAKVHWYLGGALDTRGRTAEAEQHFAEAIRLDPALAGAHLGLGIELSRQGRDSEAAAEFSEALQLEPGLIDARLRLGLALMRQRRWQEARDQFQNVLAVQPTNNLAQKYLGILAHPRVSPH